MSIPGNFTRAASNQDAVPSTMDHLEEALRLSQAIVDATSNDVTTAYEKFQVNQPIPQKLFGLILDDHAIKDANFEGSDFLITTDYMRSLLTTNRTRCADLGLNTELFIEKFTFLSNLTQNLRQLYSREVSGEKDNLSIKKQELFLQGLQEIAGQVVEAVRALEPGASLLLPGGWSNKMDAHAILYEVKKSESGNYSFAVYNTGEGLEYHPTICHGLKQKYQGSIQIENISASNITSINFYKSLFELSYLNLLKPQGEDETKGPKELYSGLLQSLGGVEVLQDQGHISYRSAQRSGTCGWKCLMEALRQSCSSYDQYRKLKYIVQCQTLVDFTEHLKKINPLDLSAKEKISLERLLKISSEKVARSLTKSFDHGWISQEELSEGHRLLERLDSSYLAQNKGQGIIEGKQLPEDAHVIKSPLVALQNKDDESDYDPQLKIKGGLPLLEEFNFEDAVHLDAKIQAYCDARNSSMGDWGTLLRIQEILCAAITKLPVPVSKGEVLWPHLTEAELIKKTEQVEKILTLLSNMSLLREVASPHALLCTYHLVAILDHLVRRTSQSKLPDVPVLVADLYELHSPGFILPTKQLQDYQASIEGYFHESEELTKGRLFEFASLRENEESEKCFCRFGLLEDFSWGEKAKQDELSEKYFIDYDYIEECLKDAAILEKLSENQIHDRKKQIQNLLDDCGKYLPLVDGRLKKAVLLALRMQYCLGQTASPAYLLQKEGTDKCSLEDSNYRKLGLISILPRAYRNKNGVREFKKSFHSSTNQDFLLSGFSTFTDENFLLKMKMHHLIA
ncbi:MAG: hypothetical protein WCG10_07505, partial [Chlamydiota bacterium]